MIENRIEPPHTARQCGLLTASAFVRTLAKKNVLLKGKHLDLIKSRTAFVGRFTRPSMVFDRSEFPVLHKLGLYAKNTAGNGLIPRPPFEIVDIDCY